MTGAGALNGRRLLIVEDEYFIAIDVARRLEDEGAEVVGPVGTVDDALDIIDDALELDGVVLDLNLSGEMAYPVADALSKRGVPFIFATGYDRSSIPTRYAGVTLCEKPVDAAKIARALFD